MLGYVLAGGESSRMQQAGSAPVDKALLVLGGKTLVERALGVAGAVCAEPRILCGPQNRCARLRRYGETVPDRVALCGPVGALQTALHDVGTRGGTWVLMVPVDLPWLTAEVLKSLVEQSLASGRAAACMHDSESVQPLPCVVHVGALPLVEAALDRRELKLLPLLLAIAGGELHLVDCADGANSRTFWNINTPADFQSAQTGETAGDSAHQSKHGRRAAEN